MADLAVLIRDVAQSNSTIAHIPYDDAYGPGFEDTPRRVPDTRKLRALLGWQPTISLEHILGQVRDHRLAGALRTA